MTETYIGPPAHDSGHGNLTPIRQVIHATNPSGPPKTWHEFSDPGMAVGTARYFQRQNAGGSAHRVFDKRDSVQCATDDTVCWHAPPNPHSLGYEICGLDTYTREQWLSPEVWPAVVKCAAQVKADAAKYKIPIRKLTVEQVKAGLAGQCGHVDVSQAFRQTDHTDPGRNFPWDRFMALLQPARPPRPPRPAKEPTPTPKPTPAPHVQEDDMALISKYPGKNDQYVLPLDLQTKVHIVDAADMAKMEHSGRYIRIDLSAAQLDAAKTIPAP